MFAQRLEHYSSIVRDVVNVLRQRGEPQAADVAAKLGTGVDAVATYLRSRDGVALWADLQNAARGRSLLLGGIGLVSGLALARAVRAGADASWTRGDYVEVFGE